MPLHTSIILAEPLLQARLITRISCTTSRGIADSCVLRPNKLITDFLQIWTKPMHRRSIWRKTAFNIGFHKMS